MRKFAMIAAVVALSACSGEDSAGDESAAGKDYTSLAQCSAKMDAVSALFGAIADTSTGSQADEMRSTSELRAAAARVLKAEAEKVAGADSGKIDTIISETKAMIDSQQEAMAFEDFAAWVGKEADGCAPMVQAIVDAS